MSWRFPHLQTKRVAKIFFKFCCIGFSLFWCVLVFTYVYSRYALCLLLQILLVAVLDVKTRDVLTVSSINSFLSQNCKATHIFFANFYVWGGGGATARFAPVVQWAKAGPDHLICHLRNIINVTSLQHSRYQHCSGDVFCHKINEKCVGKFWPVACYILSRYLQIFTLFETGVVPRSLSSKDHLISYRSAF
jgi:hypothetical protein